MTGRAALVYKMDTMTGDELRALRASLRMTQKELGEALDLSKNTIARAERGELAIPRTTAMAARYLLQKTRARKRRA